MLLVSGCRLSRHELLAPTFLSQNSKKTGVHFRSIFLVSSLHPHHLVPPILSYISIQTACSYARYVGMNGTNRHLGFTSTVASALAGEQDDWIGTTVAQLESLRGGS